MPKMASPCQIWSNQYGRSVLRCPIWLRLERKQSTVRMIQYCAKTCPALWLGWKNLPGCWKRPVPDWRPILVRLQLENYLSKAAAGFYRLDLPLNYLHGGTISNILGDFSPFIVLWRIGSEENNPRVSSGTWLFGSGRSNRNSRWTSPVLERFKSLFK